VRCTKGADASIAGDGKPGAIVGWLANLAVANVSSGWSHWDGANPACVLDGKLTCFERRANYANATPGAPRGSWWAHRAYATLSGAYLNASGGGGEAQLLASYDKARGAAAVLLGARRNLSGAALRLVGLPKAWARVHAEFYHIPFLEGGCAPIAEPVAVAALAAAAAAGVALLALPALQVEDALLVSLAPSAAALRAAAPWG
jgi:hypothetical protein